MATRLEQRIHFLTVRKRANRDPSDLAGDLHRKQALEKGRETHEPFVTHGEFAKNSIFRDDGDGALCDEDIGGVELPVPYPCPMPG